MSNTSTGTGNFKYFPYRDYSLFAEYRLSATCWCSISIFRLAYLSRDSEKIITSISFGNLRDLPTESQRGAEKRFQLIKLFVFFPSANARTSFQLEQLYTDFYVGANDRTHSALRLSNRRVYGSNKDHRRTAAGERQSALTCSCDSARIDVGYRGEPHS